MRVTTVRHRRDLWSATLAALLLTTGMQSSLAQAPASTGAAQSLESVNFFGHSLVGIATLQAAVRPLLGRTADKDTLGAVRRAVQSAYDAAGFRMVSVDAPIAAAPGSGAVLVRVRELTLSRIDMRGASHSTDDTIRAGLPALVEGRSPNLDALARELFLLNENPRRQVAVDFQPDSPGQLKAVVTISEQAPWYVSVLVDNAGNAAAGRNRLGLTLGHADVLGRGILTELAATTAPGGYRSHQTALRMRFPVLATGGTIEAAVDASRSDLGLVLGTFAISGSSRGARLAYQHPVSRTTDAEQTASVALERRHYDDIIDFAGVNLGTSIRADTLTLGFNASGRAAWAWTAQASGSANLPGGADNSSAAYAASRPGASSHWTKLQFSGAAQRKLASGWRAALRMQGQLSNDALIAGEQFRLGGASLLRGLQENEMAGDFGLAVAAEAQWPITTDLQAVAFTDGGVVRRHRPAAGAAPRLAATTGGAGLRWGSPTLSADLTVGHVVSAVQLPRSKPGSTRWHLSLRAGF